MSADERSQHPEVRYRTIVVDPPWHYKGVASDPGSRTSGARGRVERREFPYPTMTVDQIARLPIFSLADDDCRLFLWATSRYLGDAFEVLERWHFKYIQTVVWRKTGNPSPFGGSVAPNHVEFLLIGKKGKPPLWTRWVSSVIEAPAAQCGEHSRKPDVFQDLIEQVSGGPYLELFARRQRLGWDTWGNEAIEHVNLGGGRLNECPNRPDWAAPVPAISAEGWCFHCSKVRGVWVACEGEALPAHAERALPGDKEQGT